MLRHSRSNVSVPVVLLCLYLFFFNDTATTEIYTLSLHDALPISFRPTDLHAAWPCFHWPNRDRKSTRLNSSHVAISYAVFCLKKKTTPMAPTHVTTSYRLTRMRQHGTICR